MNNNFQDSDKKSRDGGRCIADGGKLLQLGIRPAVSYCNWAFLAGARAAAGDSSGRQADRASDGSPRPCRRNWRIDSDCRRVVVITIRARRFGFKEVYDLHEHDPLLDVLLLVCGCSEGELIQYALQIRHVLCFKFCWFVVNGAPVRQVFELEAHGQRLTRASTLQSLLRPET